MDDELYISRIYIYAYNEQRNVYNKDVGVSLLNYVKHAFAEIFREKGMYKLDNDLSLRLFDFSNFHLVIIKVVFENVKYPRMY